MPGSHPLVAATVGFMATASFRGTREELRAALRALPAVLAGKGPDPHNIRAGLLLRLGTVLLGQVQSDFLAKSRGGVGDDGIRWQPLKRETVARRRTTAAERKALGVGGKRVRGLLTPAQDKRWRLIFARQKALLVARFGLGGGAASARAAQMAWATLKAEGARTKLAVLGGRNVEIGRDTSTLFRSLAFAIRSGSVTVGTKVPYATAFHYGRPGRQPARNLWPTDGSLPQPWAEALSRAFARGLEAALKLILVSR